MNRYRVQGLQRGPYGEFLVCIDIKATDSDEACFLARTRHLVFPISKVEFIESI